MSDDLPGIREQLQRAAEAGGWRARNRIHSMIFTRRHQVVRVYLDEEERIRGAHVDSLGFPPDLAGICALLRRAS